MNITVTPTVSGETMKSIDNFIIKTILIIALILGITFAIGYDIFSRIYQRQSIERGYAEYNSTNGVWQWKD